MQPKEMEHLPLQLEKMFLELQNRIMRDVVRKRQVELHLQRIIS